jgi:hypothetical protein
MAVALILGLLAPATLLAQTPATNDLPSAFAAGGVVYEESFKAVFLLFVLAVLLESALALIFNWRPFVENFAPRAVRPVIAFVVAFIFVNYFNLDIVSGLVNATTTGAFPPSIAGKILTAMVIAGGSAGVNSMLIALGFRQVRTPEAVAPKPPPPNKAYISVRVTGGAAVGDLYVYLGSPPVAGAPPANPSLLGIIKGRSARNLFSWFMSDRGRLPSYGGHTIDDLDREYMVKVAGVDASGNPVSVEKGPFKFAGGAFIDIDVKV